MSDLRITKVAPMLLAFLLGSDAALIVQPRWAPCSDYQVDGVSGTLSSVLFNGTLRVRAMSLRDAVPADHKRANVPGERPVVFEAIVSNATREENHGYFNATLADRDRITVAGHPLDDGWSVEPGSAARTALGFSVPAGFVPVRLVLVKAEEIHAVAFCVLLRPTDLGAHTRTCGNLLRVL